MSAVLELRSLDAFYGSVRALREISLEIEEGEAVGLGGANGAGKSTLLKAVVGMVSTRGSIRLGGEPIERRSTAARIRAGLVYVPQERMVVSGISVADNLRLFWLAGDRKQSFERAAASVFDAFPELAARERTAAGALSGGERQMLALSRAFLTSGPRLLLLDEPSAGLAPLVVERIAELIEEWRRGGLTYLLLEQNERLLERCSARRLRLASGELVQNGGAPAAAGGLGKQNEPGRGDR